MAHFAKLGSNSKVIQVLTLNNGDMLNADGVEDESVGQQYLERHNNWPAQMWIQTSYNTQGGKHSSGDDSKALRGNYAGIGYIWDEDNNIFFSKSPFPSCSCRIFYPRCKRFFRPEDIVIFVPLITYTCIITS